MEENKLAEIVLKRLITDYADCLEWCESSLVVRYRNVCDVSEFRKGCALSGMDVGDGTVSKEITEVINLTSSPSYGYLPLEEPSEHIVQGEILRLVFVSGGGMDIVKLSGGRWWIPYANGIVSAYADTYQKISGTIGPGTVIVVKGTEFTISSAKFIIPTKAFQMIDDVISLACYLKDSLEDNVMESFINSQKMELSKMVKTLDGRKWMDMASYAYSKGFDYKTLWYITNAVIINLKRR